MIVSLIAPIDEFTPLLKNQDGVTFIPLKSLDRDSTGLSSNYSLFREFEHVYTQIRPDVILHYTSKPIIFGGRAAYKMNIPSIAIVTGLGYAFINRGWIHRITKYLYKKSANYHQLFLFENEDDLALFDNNIIQKGQGKSVKGCGVDEIHFSPIPRTFETSQTTFTFIGRLLLDKGINEFVQVAKYFKKNTKIQFKVIGQLDDQNPSKISEDKLQSWIDNEYISYVSFKKDIRTEIASSDCVVLPSYREGLPRTILEAMSMEKPIIVSDTPGCRETVVDEENGFLVNVRDVESLKSAVSKFMQLSSIQRNEMGVKGRKLVLEKFTAKKIANQIFDEISSIAFS